MTGKAKIKIQTRPGTGFAVAVAAIALLSYSCSSSPPPAPEKTATPAPPALVLASKYGQGDGFNGRKTASGEPFDPNALTAAHRTLPFGTVLKVRNPKTDKSVEVRVNDRGPYVKNRLLDLSAAAAEKLGMGNAGVIPVEIETVTQPAN